MSMTNQEKREFVVSVLTEAFGPDCTELTRADVVSAMEPYLDQVAFPFWVTHAKNRLKNGNYKFPQIDGAVVSVGKPKVEKVEEEEVANVVSFAQRKLVQPTINTVASGFDENLVPKKNPMYVPFGYYNTVHTVVKSGMFYPMFVTGMSGNGKTHMIEQVCSKLKRECIRVNFTKETDEDDLIGGFRLIDGETVFFKGPVIKAMERGAVLLLDEIDLACPAKVMCLQSILEGSGYFIKKTGEYITPAEGFTAVATANTKGKGSDDGRFIATNVLNEAFLERFPITIEQEYPPVAIEKRIILKEFQSLGVEDSDFVRKLVEWADIIRKTFEVGGVDDIISTRRLIHIAKAYSIFKNRLDAINLCINRFDDDTKQSFLELYSKLDSDVDLSNLGKPTSPDE